MDFCMINELPPESTQSSKTISLIFPESGSLFEYPISKFVSPFCLQKPITLMELIERKHGIPQVDQVILREADGKQLESSMDLKDYFEHDDTLYIFNIKNFREEGSSSDDFEVIYPQSPGKSGKNDWRELGFECLPELSELYLKAVSKGELDAISSIRLDEMMALFCDVKNEVVVLKEGNMKLQRQKHSEDVVKRNLMGYYQEKKRKIDETFSHIKSKISCFQNLLENFEENLEKLSKIELNPLLSENGKKYLIDYFDVIKLQANKKQYLNNQIKIVAKSEEMQKEMTEYDQQLQNLDENIPHHYEEILELIFEQEYKFNQIYSQNIKDFQYNLSNHYENLDLSKLTYFINREWENSLPILRIIFQELQKIRTKVDDFLKDNAKRLQNFVSDVANIQIIIRGKLQNKHTVFRSLVEKHERDIFSLEIIANFPSAYTASINEIQRRYKSKMNCLAFLNSFHHFVNNENRQRQNFYQKVGPYLPKDFCPLLGQSFPDLDFETLHKLIEQDESFPINESVIDNFDVRKSNNFTKVFENSNQIKEDKERKTHDLINKYKENLENKKNSPNEKMKSFKFENSHSTEEVLNHRESNVDNKKVQNHNQKLIEVLQEINRRCENKYDQLMKELNFEKEERKQMECRFTELKNINEKLLTEKEKSFAEKYEAQIRAKKLSDEIEQMKLEQEKKCKDFTDELNEKMETIANLNQAMDEKETLIEKLNRENGEHSQLLETTIETVKEKERIINYLKNQNIHLSEQLYGKDNQNLNVEFTLNDMKNETMALRRRNAQFEKILKEIKQELDISIQHQENEEISSETRITLEKSQEGSLFGEMRENSIDE